MTEALTSNYWISPNAVRITLNAMGKKDYIQCGAAGGAVIMCYIRDVDGLGYDAGHNYRRWPIVTAPVYFNSWTRKYVYIAIPRSTAVGTSAILVFPSERIDLYGMTEPAEGETEGEQIGSKDYYYIFLRGVISPSRSDDDADQLREWEEYVDYGTLSTDQQISEGDSEWWRYNADDDTVTFLKVITNATFKVLNVLKSLIVGGDASIGKNLSVGGTLDVKGQATIDNIKSHNYTGDGLADTGWSLTNSYNGHSKLTIDEIYVRMKAVFESLEVRERTYTGGDQIWSCAGNYVHRTDYMTDTPKTVWVEADGTERTDEAETEEEKAAAARRAQDIMDEEDIELYEVPVAGNTVGYSMIKVPWLLKGMALVLGKNNGLVRGLFSHYKKVRITMHRSPAHGGTGDESDEQVLATVRRVRCYFLAKDNERQVHNWWRINDLARCQTMNLENVVRETYLESATSKTGNVFWWRKVIGVSTNPVRLDDGKWYHYFDVAFNSKIEESTDPSIHASMATFAMEGSDIPAAGDSVVQFGNTIIEGRMNLMMMEVNGGDSIGYSASTDAPCLKAYRGIYCFDLNKCWVGGSPCKMKLSPSTGYEFYGPNIKFVTEYAIVPVPIERPEIYWTNIGRRKDAMGNWIDSWTFEEDAYNRAEPTPYSDDAKTHRDYSSFINPDGSVRAGAPVRKCYYYEKVSHNGCYFICSIVDGAHWEAEETFSFNGVTYPANRWINDGTYNSFSAECQGKCKRVPNYTIEEPSAESQDWTMTVNRGSEPIAVYKWAQEGTSISAPTINKAQWAAWTDGSQPIDGWTKTAPNRPTQNPETWYLFMSQNTLYADGSISTWSTPTRISGSQGTPGEDAGDTEWIYLINNSSVNPGAPNNITNGSIPDPNNPGQRIPSTDKTKDDWVPNGWTDNPDGIAWNQQYEWASFRTKAKGANVDPNIRWSDFSVPIIWSHWGQNGMDGDGVEYVYMRTKNNVALIVAYNDNINRTAHGKTYLDDEYLPVISNNDATKSDATKAWAESNECTDDPKGISRDWPYEWCLKRVMTPANAETGKRTWRCYGGTAAGQTQEMDLWNHYAENAIRLDLDNEMDSVQTDSQGKILSVREVSTVIRLWDGATEVDISAVDFTASGRISGSPASTVATFSQAASGKGKQLKWTFIAEQSMPTAYEITISYVYLNETHRCTLTIAASMGQPVYQLKPSRSSLPCAVNSSNVYINPPALSLSVVKVDGASTDEITTIGSGGTIESGTIFIRYSLDSMPTGKTAGSAWPTANSVQATSDKENVYIAMFNAAGTLLDRETIPIVKDGKNGENAIRLDLDNENDSMLYTGDGTLVSGNVISKAYMFDGANDVSSQTTWSATASGCTITNASKTSRDIEITGMTAAKAKVTVQGVYKDSHNNTHTKTAVLTLKKIVDGDKYDLIITPNSIAYNSSTDTPDASTIDIQVWKTSVNSSGGVNRVQAPPPTGYAVYAGSTALTAVSTGKYSYTTDNSAISEVQVKIAKTTDLNDILDAETIPVNKAKNGENSIRLALDNEHEDFLYSKDGLVAPSGGATSQAHLYDGPTEISASNVEWAVSCDGGSTFVNAGSSFTTGSVAKAKISSAGLLTIGEIYVNAAKVKVRAKYPNNSSGKFYYAEFTGNKTNQDKYDIIVKPNAISYNSSEAWTDKTITISAEGIDAQGNKLTPSIAKEATPVYGKFYVFFGYVNSDGSIRDIDNLMGNSFMLSKMEADSCEGLYFELRYYNDANDATKYRLCDYETVEIAKTVNGSDAEQVNPNILLRTIFDNGITPVKEKWVAEWEHVYIDTASDTITDGRKSIRINANGLSSYVDFKQDVYGRLKPNTWYTLSFNSYANYPWHTYIYPSSEGYTCLDRTEWYIDGVRSTSVPINGRVEWPANWQGKRHTITFKTSSSFSTEKIDIIFRALAGVQVCICMPKLEIGKTATAYMANEDDLIGANGNSAYVVVPENLIINQNLDGSMPTTDDILFKVKSGGSEWNGTVASVGTITDYLPTLPSGATGLSEHHSTASISSGKLKISSIGYYSYTYGGKTITSYYDHVSFAITVTANGVTVSHIFHVYINLLGSFKTTIEGDIEESIATKTYFVYDKDGNVVGSQTIGDFIRSSSTNTSILTETVSNLSTANVENLFGFTKGVRLVDSDWPVLPYIQGYGVEIYQAYNGTTRGRIQNLGFNGVEGSYVLSCEIKASQVVSGEAFTIDLCDKTPASVISGLNSDGKYEPSVNEWTRVIAVFDLTRETISDFDSYVGEKGFNGFMDAESNKNSGTHLYIRRLQIERGTMPSVFGICKEDAEYVSQHDHEYVKNASNVELDDTGKWYPYPNTGAHFIQTSDVWNGMSVYRNSAPLTNSSGATDGNFRIMEMLAGELKITAGTPYTLSFWARVSSGNLKMRSFLVCDNTGGDAYEENSVMEYVQSASTLADGRTKVTLDTSWRKYYVHFYAQKNKNTSALGYATAYGIRITTEDMTGEQRTSNNFYYYICGMKLEKGYITSDDRMNYETVVHQTSRSIDMSVLVNAVKKAGIELTTNQEGDVTTGVIRATADQFEWQNTNGEKILGLDSSGNAKFSGKVEATGGKITGVLTVGSSNNVRKIKIDPSDGWGATIKGEVSETQYFKIGIDQNSLTSAYIPKIILNNDDASEKTTITPSSIGHKFVSTKTFTLLQGALSWGAGLQVLDGDNVTEFSLSKLNIGILANDSALLEAVDPNGASMWPLMQNQTDLDGFAEKGRVVAVTSLYKDSDNSGPQTKWAYLMVKIQS